MAADKPAPNRAVFHLGLNGADQACGRLALLPCHHLRSAPRYGPRHGRRCILIARTLHGGEYVAADGRRSMPLKGGQLTTTAAMGNWSIN